MVFNGGGVGGGFGPPEDIWQCLETFLFVTAVRGCLCAGILWVEAKDAGKHPSVHRRAKDYSVQNVKMATAQKP